MDAFLQATRSPLPLTHLRVRPPPVLPRLQLKVLQGASSQPLRAAGSCRCQGLRSSPGQWRICHFMSYEYSECPAFGRRCIWRYSQSVVLLWASTAATTWATEHRDQRNSKAFNDQRRLPVSAAIWNTWQNPRWVCCPRSRVGSPQGSGSPRAGDNGP